jgi:hypothetical protein
MEVQTLMTQYGADLAQVLDVYNRRFALECPDMPRTLGDLVLRLRSQEYTWRRGFAITASTLAKIDPATNDDVFVIVLDRLTQDMTVVTGMQDDIAVTLEFKSADVPVAELQRVTRLVRDFSSACKASCDYVLQALEMLATAHDVYGKALARTSMVDQVVQLWGSNFSSAIGFALPPPVATRVPDPFSSGTMAAF